MHLLHAWQQGRQAWPLVWCLLGCSLHVPADKTLAGVMQSICAAGQGGFAQQQMHEAWQAYLDFEMRNPQRLEAAALAARVLHAYEQALMVLLHYPEVRQPAAGRWC